MWIVVKYSKKSVKSDYFGVIICIWWRSFQKIRIFAKQNTKYTVNWYKDSDQIFGIFLKNYTVEAFYVQNTPKTRDIWCNSSEKSGNSPFCVQILKILTYLWGKTPKNQNFPLSVKQIFAKYLQFYMWVYKGIKVNFLAIAQKIAVVLIYKINPVQITTITAENTENSLNLVAHTIENIQFKTVRNSHLL